MDHQQQFQEAKRIIGQIASKQQLAPLNTSIQELADELNGHPNIEFIHHISQDDLNQLETQWNAALQAAQHLNVNIGIDVLNNLTTKIHEEQRFFTKEHQEKVRKRCGLHIRAYYTGFWFVAQFSLIVATCVQFKDMDTAAKVIIIVADVFCGPLIYFCWRVHSGSKAEDKIEVARLHTQLTIQARVLMSLNEQ